MIDQIWQGLITPILIAFVFWLLGKYYPIETKKYKTEKTLKALKKEFGKFDTLAVLFVFIAGPIVIFLINEVVTSVADWRFAQMQEDGFLFLPEQAMWFIPAIFAGLGVTGILWDTIQKAILKERHKEYVAYSSLKNGFDAERASSLFLRVLAVLVVSFCTLGINYYAHFGEEKIRIANFFQLTSSTYTYQDVVAVKLVDKLVAPNGNIVEDKHYVVDFVDASKWNTRSLEDLGGKSIEEAIDSILEKTTLDLEILEFDTD